jgi:hypothetical protein
VQHAAYRRGTKRPEDEVQGVTLLYGDVTEAAAASPFALDPSQRGPAVRLSEIPRPSEAFIVHSGRYWPPRGTAVLSGRFALANEHGVYVAIDATSHELVLAAAHALEPMPG